MAARDADRAPELPSGGLAQESMSATSELRFRRARRRAMRFLRRARARGSRRWKRGELYDRRASGFP